MVGYILRIKERYYEFGGRIDFGRSPCSFEVAMEGAVLKAAKHLQNGSWTVGRVVEEAKGSLGPSQVHQNNGSLLDSPMKATCNLRWQYVHHKKLNVVHQTLI